MLFGGEERMRLLPTRAAPQRARREAETVSACSALARSSRAAHDALA